MSVSRRQFVGLVSVAWIEDFAAKTSVSRENVSFIGDHLSLLISGRCVKDCSQSLNYSSRGGGSLQVRGLKGRSSSPKDQEQRWGSRPPTRVFEHSGHSVRLIWHSDCV